jgi:pimeloyl-ACP methyl ester carboxylesterase
MPVESVNGVPISYEEAGEGEAVVLVHGTTGSGAGWVFVAPQLAQDFRVVTYDRRGRGQSGDGSSYSIEDDVHDLVALIRRLGPPVHVVGHSIGARVALAATARVGPEVASLVLYEPPLEVDAVSRDTWDAIDEATRRYDWEQVLELFYPAAGLTPEEIAALRSLPPAWEAALDGARTVSREIVALRNAPIDLDTLRHITVPSLVLVGSETDTPVYLNGLADVATALNAVTEELEGQRHVAPMTAPDLFAGKVRDFIRATVT